MLSTSGRPRSRPCQLNPTRGVVSASSVGDHGALRRHGRCSDPEARRASGLLHTFVRTPTSPLSWTTPSVFKDMPTSMVGSSSSSRHATISIRPWCRRSRTGSNCISKAVVPPPSSPNTPSRLRNISNRRSPSCIRDAHVPNTRLDQPRQTIELERSDDARASIPSAPSHASAQAARMGPTRDWSAWGSSRRPGRCRRPHDGHRHPARWPPRMRRDARNPARHRSWC
jgi:hypothetical protein